MKKVHTDYVPFAAQIDRIGKVMREKGIHIRHLIKSSYSEELKTHIINAVRKYDVRLTRDTLRRQYLKWKPGQTREHLAHHPEKGTIPPHK